MRTCVIAYLRAYVRMRSRVCVYLCSCVRKFVRVNVCVCMCVCMCMCACKYVLAPLRVQLPLLGERIRASTYEFEPELPDPPHVC